MFRYLAIMGKNTSLCTNLLNSYYVRGIWQFNYFAFSHKLFHLSNPPVFWSRVPLCSRQRHNPQTIMVSVHSHPLFHKDIGKEMWRSISLDPSSISCKRKVADIYGFRLDRVSTESQIFSDKSTPGFLTIFVYVCVLGIYGTQPRDSSYSSLRAVLAKEEGAEQSGDKGSLDVTHWKVSPVRAPISQCIMPYCIPSWEQCQAYGRYPRNICCVNALLAEWLA